MKSTYTKHLFWLAALAVLSMVTAISHAQGNKVVQGIEVSYGVTSAKDTKKSRDQHDEKMHKKGGLFKGGSHHLVVALKDQTSGKQIEDATVVAKVHALGTGSTERKLEPMKVGDTLTYGGYFDMPPSGGPYKVTVQISTPTIPSHSPAVAEFEYRPATSR